MHGVANMICGLTFCIYHNPSQVQYAPTILLFLDIIRIKKSIKDFKIMNFLSIKFFTAFGIDLAA